MKARITWIFHGLHPEAGVSAIKKALGRKIRRDLNANLSPGGTVEYISGTFPEPHLITVYNVYGDVVSRYKLGAFETRLKKVKPITLPAQ
jgi:hypothetical protein